MKKLNINIISKHKIIFDILSQNSFYISNKIIYLELNKNLDLDQDSFNLIFISNDTNNAECIVLEKKLRKLKKNNYILCIDRKFISIFSSYEDNLIFTPVQILDIEKKTTLLNLSIISFYKDLELKKKENTLINKNMNKKIALTQIETSILEILFDSPSPVSREKINRNVLGYNKLVDSHSLDSHIYRLRKKITNLSTKVKIEATSSGCYVMK